MDLIIVLPWISCLIALVMALDDVGDLPTKTKEAGFSCAHCATPRWVTNQKEITEALEQFLEARGSIHYPYDVQDSNCYRPRNISAIKHRQRCHYDYCYSITFRDKNGVPLTLRGCAEYYMGTGGLKTSHCKKMSKALDIVQCVCKGGDICNSAFTRTYSTIIIAISTIIWLTCMRFR